MLKRTARFVVYLRIISKRYRWICPDEVEVDVTSNQPIKMGVCIVSIHIHILWNPYYTYPSLTSFTSLTQYTRIPHLSQSIFSSPLSSLCRSVAFKSGPHPVLNNQPHFVKNPSETSHSSTLNGSPHTTNPLFSSPTRDAPIETSLHFKTFPFLFLFPSPSFFHPSLLTGKFFVSIPPRKSFNKSLSSNVPACRISESRNPPNGKMSIHSACSTFCCKRVGWRHGGRRFGVGSGVIRK